MKYLKLLLLFLIILISNSSLYAIESLNGFLITAYDDSFRVVSPEKFRSPLEVIVENKTLVRLVGKVIINNKIFFLSDWNGELSVLK